MWRARRRLAKEPPGSAAAPVPGLAQSSVAEGALFTGSMAGFEPVGVSVGVRGDEPLAPSLAPELVRGPSFFPSLFTSKSG